MDPYLEAPDIWPDFHHALAASLRDRLNRSLPRPYYARLQMRPEIGIVGGEEPRRIVADVAVVTRREQPGPPPDPTVAVLDHPRIDVSRSVRMRVPNERLRHHYVEIRDASRGHELVTLIEIVSPSNKRPGPDRRAYEAKQGEVLESDTSLIEVDLLRGGQPVVGGAIITDAVSRLDSRPDYLVAISRAWQRGPAFDYELFPVRLDESLPCIPVPLREGQSEVPLDLQYTFNQAYDGGPYARGAVDYGSPPDPPVRTELANWLTGCLSRWETRLST